jgi:hypothetical protein
MGFLLPVGHANMLHSEPEPLLTPTDDVDIPPFAYLVDIDLSSQGKTDFLSGHTIGQSVCSPSDGTPIESIIDDYVMLASEEGFLIDLPGSFRLRPFVPDWADGDYSDILARPSDNKMHLFQGIPEPTTIFVIMITAGFLIIRRRRRTLC